MKAIFSKLSFLAALAILALMPTAGLAQSASAALASLPDADVLIYVSPQKILSEAAPRVMPAKELSEMRTAFADLKKSVGIDPSTVEYLVLALRFHKPAGDLSFVAPDVMAVAGGDFSSDSLLTLAQLAMQDKMRVEKFGSKTIAVMKVDPIAAQAEKTPMLKSLAEMGAVPLSANSIAIGNLRYLKSAVEAADGADRLNPAMLESLLRDPNALVAATGAPLASFAKAFGLYGTETTPREGRCETPFGNFYAAITMNGTSFNLRGAMNADNPDTAKIISGLLAGLMQHGASAVPAKEAKTIMQTVKMVPKDNEVIVEADIPTEMVADLLRRPPAPPKPATSPEPATKRKPTTRKPVRRKRTQ